MTVFVDDANTNKKACPRFARGRKPRPKPTKVITELKRKTNSERQRLWRNKNPEKARQIVRNYRARLLVEFGATPKPASCEACGSAKSKICADHNHDTGHFHGWLCNDCNLTLGKMKDNPARLRALADYLEARDDRLR